MTYPRGSEHANDGRALHRLRLFRAGQVPHPSALVRWTLAPALTLSVVLLQLVLLPEPRIAPFLPFVVPVALTAVLAGRLQGLAAVGLSAASANYFLVAPHDALAASGPALTATAVFVAASSAVALLCSSFRRVLLDMQRVVSGQGTAQAALRLERDFTSAVLDTAGSLVVVFDRDRRITRFNRGCESVTGYSAAEAQGRTFDFLIPPEQLAEVREVWEALLGGTFPSTYENHWVSKDGTRRLIAWSNTAILGPDGEVAHVIGTGMDITERSQAEAALRASEERFRALATASSEVLYRMSPDWSEMRQLRSQGFLADTDHPNADWLDEYIHADDQPQVTAAIREAIRTKSLFQFEHRVRRADGSLGWTLSRAVPVMDGEGHIVEWFGAATDVTERKQAELGLQESEERLKRAEKIAHLGSWELDVPTGRLFWSDEVYRLFGLEPRAFGATYEAFLEAVHPEDRAAVDEAYSRSLREGRGGYEMEHRIVRKATGEIRVVREKCEHVRDASGRIIRSVGMVHDITDRKRAEEGLRQSEATLNAFFEASPGILNVVDEELRYVKCDSTTPTYFGLTRESIIGKSVRELAPEFAGRFGALLQEVVTSGVPKQDQEVFSAVPGKRGEVAIWRASYFPVPLREGRHGVGVMGVDITDLKKAEAAREHLVQALREEDRRKTEFLAVLSHELRNPLTPIRNSLYILERAAPGGDQARRAKAIIGRQVDQLARLVDDLLDVTRLTRNMVKLQPARLDLCELVRRAVEDHRSTFEQAEVALVVQHPPGPVFVDGDWNRLAQVVGNLLANAAKFTPPGGRTSVSVSVGDAPRRAALRVSDTGVGMGADLLARLFQPFIQASQGLDRSKGGLGLGLALVKGMVELHGGEVEARSEGLGKGTVVTIRLPLATRMTAGFVGATRSGGRAPLRVLVIEDNVDAADSLREVLSLGGDTVEVAYSGPEGLEKARELRPDVVFCDIGLPELDGYAVGRAFRADARLRSTYLVALTGYALPEDVARSRKAGFDRHVAKPPSMEEIAETLAAASAQPRDAPAADSPPVA